ncbi:DUF134 domain-containing protein [Thiorhodococcus mannitoliphagus]|uniref:UPF0251 protein G3480_08055 n=1 Tax=Thiorhodococcus mannitoliphagus TaxID=329406 RepID=A0A6P1DPR7_9GAMM|nr:DUF134 domain-containing protein [Thiorhodococcus mannitoliphagus]NEX20267.1 DUF134 domain-containing protein [Thiorhodococcus mannitoliphagus]
MPGRRRRARCIDFAPTHLCFKPCGRPGRDRERISLRADEFEAVRLADLEGLYQEAAARRMGISRTTLSRTLAEARRKIAEALVEGKRLVVELDQKRSSADAEVDGDYADNRPSLAAEATKQHRGRKHEEDCLDGE